ncbi:MAG: 2-C-methyl-D-erythritol 4-phosphate cytidylyltransferase [Ascidiaceihabitans sp.]|jgi:2-C-methyl-D-erythritol 4-phosphate cytidylyltransferase
MNTAAIIVAAGRGTRAGGATPKQWREIAGQSVLLHTLQAFDEHSEIDCVVLVLHVDDLDRAPAVDGLIVATGGSERAASVKAGLQAVPSAIRNVLIHDVARPCISPSTISDIIAALDITVGAAPALPVTDALWTGSDGHVTGTKDRRDLYRAQTPQGFHLDAIIAAHAAYVGSAADDVEVARAAGIEVAIVAGDEDNLKITLPADFERAQRILERRNGH